MYRFLNEPEPPLRTVVLNVGLNFSRLRPVRNYKSLADLLILYLLRFFVGLTRSLQNEKVTGTPLPSVVRTVDGGILPSVPSPKVRGSVSHLWFLSSLRHRLLPSSVPSGRCRWGRGGWEVFTGDLGLSFRVFV